MSNNASAAGDQHPTPPVAPPDRDAPSPELGPDYEGLPRGGIQSLPAVRSFLAKTLVFTLIGVFVVGVIATVSLSAAGVTADSVSSFLHDALTTLVPLVAAVVGFYFGAEGRDRNSTDPKD